jgi:hypothetical protein
MHDVGALKKTIFAVHNRMFPRAAGINPPCFAIRTLCRENHALFADSATPEQERRVLAHRGVRYGRCAARINALLADDATPKQKRRASTRRALRTTPPTAIPRRHQTHGGCRTPFAKNFCEQNCPLETAAVYQRGAFASDVRWFFVGGLEFDPADRDERGYGIVHVWDVKERRLAARYRVSHERVISLALSPDGKLLAVSDTAGRLQVFPLPDQFSKTQR